MGACLGKLNAARANAKNKSKSKTDEKATAKSQPAETTTESSTQVATKDVQQSVTDATTTEEQSTSDTKTPVKEAPPTDITASTDAKEDTSKPVESTGESPKPSPEKDFTPDDKVDTQAEAKEAAPKHDAIPADDQAPSVDKLQTGFSVLMAGTLEAVRAGIAECDEVSSSGVLRNFIVSFSDLTLATKNEMVIEEEAYFPLLDENFDGVAENAKLYEAHRADEILEAKVDEALSNKEIDDATTAFAEWKQHHLDHIDRELEAVASPLASLASKLGEDRLPTLLNERILGAHMDDMPWFVSWNCAMLANHKPFESLAAWVAALQSISTPAQWKKLLPAVYAPLSEDTREQLRQIGADESGKVV